jgi:hypothetical protein
MEVRSVEAHDGLRHPLTPFRADQAPKPFDWEQTVLRTHQSTGNTAAPLNKVNAF